MEWSKNPATIYKIKDASTQNIRLPMGMIPHREIAISTAKDFPWRMDAEASFHIAILVEPTRKQREQYEMFKLSSHNNLMVIFVTLCAFLYSSLVWAYSPFARILYNIQVVI